MMKFASAVPYVLAYAVIDLKKATIKIVDGGAGSSQKEVVIKIGEGNLTWTERKEREYLLDRGLIDEVRDGDETPMEVSMDFNFEYYQSVAASGTPTPIEALKKVGEASAWVSTDVDPCRPYCVDIIVEYDPGCGTGTTETLTFPDFRYEDIGGDIRGGTFSCTGRCNATEPTSVRA